MDIRATDSAISNLDPDLLGTKVTASRFSGCLWVRTWLGAMMGDSRWFHVIQPYVAFPIET